MADRPVDLEALLRHRPFVKALARRLVRDDARAEDVVQDTYVTAMENPPQHGGALRAWLATVVRKMAWTHNRSEARRAAREHKREMPVTPPTPDEVVERAQWHQRLVNIVMELDEPYRGTVLLSYFEGLTSQEIALLHEVSPATVRTRLHRAIAKLRARLDDDTDGGRSAWLGALTLLGWPPPVSIPPAAPTSPAPEPMSPAPLWPWVAITAGVLGFGVLAVWSQHEPMSARRSTERSERAAVPTPDEGGDTDERTRDHERDLAKGLAVVVMQDGRPCADAAVVVLRHDAHLWLRSPFDRWTEWARARTNQRGIARVPNVPSGYARFLATAPGRGRGATLSHFPHEFEESIVIDLPVERTVAIHVRDGAGAPIAGAQVNLHDAGDAVRVPGPSTWTTNAEGRAVVGGLAPHEHATVRIEADGYERSRAYELDAQSVTAVLTETAGFVRWILDQGTAPREGSRLELRRSNEEFPVALARVEQGQLVTDELPAGWIPDLLAVDENGRIALLSDVSTELDQPLVFFDPQYFDVRLRDRKGPVAGMNVRLFDARSGGPRFPDAKTGEEGLCRFAVYTTDPLRVGWRAATRPFRMAGLWSPTGGARVVDVELPSSIRVTLALREPIPGEFALYQGEERLAAAAWSLSDDRRALQIDLRPHRTNESLTLSILAHGRSPWQGSFARDASLDIALQKTGALVLHVARTRSNRPYALELVTEQEPTRGPFPFRLYAGPDHVVREKMLPPGRYRVVDRSSGITTKPFVVAADATTEVWLDLNREPDGLVELRGRVEPFRDIDLSKAQVLVRAPDDDNVFESVRVEADGSFRLAWWPGVAQMRLVAMHPEAERSPVMVVERPRDYVALRLRPAMQTRFPLSPHVPADALVRVRAGEFFLPARMERGALAVAGFRNPSAKAWIDIAGFVPRMLPAGTLRTGEGEPLTLARGTVLRLRILTRDDTLRPELQLVARTNATTNAPGYVRSAKTTGSDIARIEGLGAGRFHVTAWDPYTGTRVWSHTVEADGSTAQELTIDLR